MSIDVNNPYVRNKVMTAGPEQLRMMLLEGCVRFLREGRAGLADKDYERAYNGFSQGKAIVLELTNALRPEIDPELCARLQGLYVFIFRQITEGAFEKDLAKIDKAIELMVFECETWQLVLDKLTEERAGQAAPGQSPPAAAVRATGTHGPAHPAAPTAAPGDRPSLSLEG